MTSPDSSEEQASEDSDEEGPGITGDLASWLYVLGGIPMMALFFVVMFGLIGSCDAQNIMLYG